MSEAVLYGDRSDRALTVWPWRLLVGEDGPRLYNVESDPFERDDLAADEPERVAELSRMLDEIRARAERRAAHEVEVDRRRQLEAQLEEVLSRHLAMDKPSLITVPVGEMPNVWSLVRRPPSAGGG